MLAACLGLAGCARFNLRGDPFPEDDISALSRQLRPHDTNAEAWGASNKALQIENDLGYQ